ncbi:hypothetical protein [Allosphingosinicella sp.]|uniref:hypothetical protein n=1 Tax=Allosphingosinicella sp. TaxID=2823234 RepID=UPI0037838068
MRVLVRTLLQFAAVFAAIAVFVVVNGDPRAWLLLFYLMAIGPPGLLLSVLVLAPLERALDQRGRGAWTYVAGPAATALLALLFMQFAGNNWSEVVAALPVFLLAGGGWGLLWALTRPLARRLFGPEAG